MVYYDEGLDELTIQIDIEYEIPKIEEVNTVIQDSDLDWEFVELEDNKNSKYKSPLLETRCRQYYPFNRW